MRKRTNKIYLRALNEMRSKAPRLDVAWSMLEEALNEGSADAAYAMATWYLHGMHVRKNASKAVALLEIGSTAGIPSAKYDLAICYENGKGVVKNLKKAFSLYVEAALRGESSSIYEVGRCYFYGIGTRQDRTVARLWLDRAREVGITEQGGREADARLRERIAGAKSEA